MRHAIVIPEWHPPRTNQWVGRHWSVKHKLRRQASEMLAVYARAAGVPQAGGKRRVTLTVALAPRQRGRGQRPDHDAYAKLFLDACVQAGLLVDDAEEWVEFMPVRFSEQQSGNVWWGTEILFEDMS